MFVVLPKLGGLTEKCEEDFSLNMRIILFKNGGKGQH